MARKNENLLIFVPSVAVFEIFDFEIFAKTSRCIVDNRCFGLFGVQTLFGGIYPLLEGAPSNSASFGNKHVPLSAFFGSKRIFPTSTPPQKVHHGISHVLMCRVWDPEFFALVHNILTVFVFARYYYRLGTTHFDNTRKQSMFYF